MNHSGYAADTAEADAAEGFLSNAQIKVIGVGGGGSNAVQHMIERGVRGVEFICANTDAQALKRSGAQRLLQLGHSGLGAGAKPDVGRTCAEEAEEGIREALAGSQMVFITAGLGGGTGTGAAPVIAKVAKEMGILTVGVVTKPFDFEGPRRMRAADEGLRQLEEQVDSLIVVLNDRLLEVLGEDVTQDAAFTAANDVLRSAVGGITDVIHIPGLVNVDFEDVKTVMEQPGRAMMGTAQCPGPDRSTKAAEMAIACPLLEGIDLSGANGVLVLIAASKQTFKLAETRNVMNAIRRYAHPEAHIIMGAAFEEELGDQMRVTVIATGLSAAQRASAVPQSQTVVQLRTGTDGGIPVMHSPVPPMGRGVPHGQPHVPQGMIHPSQQQHQRQPAPNLTVPSVWRSGRANAKVDALVQNGMDEIEIPAFLRKQAD